MAMTLDEYQLAAGKTNKGTALYTISDDGTELNIIAGMYNALALNGEAGELAEKVKKHARDGIKDFETHRLAVAKEIGDCMWYISQLARDFGYTLDEIAHINLKKLHDREARNMLGGSGDER